MRGVLLLAIFLMISFPALAQFEAPAHSQPESAATSPTRVEVDEAQGVVRILVAGREVVRIDANGLHVQGDIVFTGTVIDSGASEPKP